LLKFFGLKLLIYSSEVHLTKDSPVIFRLAAKRAGLTNTPLRCMFVGEDAGERNEALAAHLLRVCGDPRQVRHSLTRPWPANFRLLRPSGTHHKSVFLSFLLHSDESKASISLRRSTSLRVSLRMQNNVKTNRQAVKRSHSGRGFSVVPALVSAVACR
jgi:hypothetical protein